MIVVDELVDLVDPHVHSFHHQVTHYIYDIIVVVGYPHMAQSMQE